MKTEPDELIFVVRMWVQGGNPFGMSEWRGAIQDVHSGKRFYIAGTRDIADFIDARIEGVSKTANEYERE